MSLIDTIKIFLPEGLHYECQNCGKCCQRWNFLVDPDTFFNLQDAPFMEELKKKHPNTRIMWFDSDKDSAYLGKIDGKCIMLDDNMCTIHRELGYESKPHGCRCFPFLPTVTPDGVFVGISYTCHSICNNIGRPMEEWLPAVKNLLKITVLNNPVGTEVAIAGNLSTDWEGYKVIEEFINNCIEKDGAMYGTADALVATAILVKLRSAEAPVMLSPDEIKSYFDNPIPTTMTRDEEFDYYRMQTTATLISILESEDPEKARDNTGIILNGGTIESETFNKIIQVKPLREYMDFAPLLCERQLVIDYIKHLVWRKYLLKIDNLIFGMSVFYMLPIMFTWYAFASANINKREEPAEEDLRTALRWVEGHIHHGRFLDRFVRSFSADLLNQVAYFVDQDLL